MLEAVEVQGVVECEGEAASTEEEVTEEPVLEETEASRVDEAAANLEDAESVKADSHEVREKVREEALRKNLLLKKN